MLTDITEHRTDEGKVYLCAIKDVYSSKIVGYSIDSRMMASLAVAALDHAFATRSPVATIVHTDRGSLGGFNRLSQHFVIVEVLNGSSSACSRSGDQAEAPVAGSSEVPAPCRGGLLGADR